MNISKKVNEVRRAFMRDLTKRIGNSRPDAVDFTGDLKIKKILISRPNDRLGNLLLITPLLQEIAETFPESTVDLFVRGNLAPILFRNYSNVGNILQLPKKPFKQLLKYAQVWLAIRKQQYDLVINIDKNSSSGRLSTKFSRSRFKIFGDFEDDNFDKEVELGHMAKYPVYAFRNYFSSFSFIKKDRSIPNLNLKLSVSEIAEGKKKLMELVKNDKKTISIFTYATGNKCYSEAWWMAFYERLRKEYANYNIIEILPMHNASQIGFSAPSFYSKDVREMGSVIANTELFIGADSGIMHLATASQTPTVGLFSVTDAKRYQPYGNKSTGINTNILSEDGCIKELNKILMAN
jgi:ADP-heptose:LPS heptosyltransferase